MDSAELNFILKIRDEATAVIKAHAGAIRELGAAHGGVKESAKEAETGLSALVNKSKEAAEAFGAMWTASELNEKTLGAFAEMEVAMLRLQQASGATAAGIREMQEGIESIAGRSLNQTAEQIAGVEKAAAQLGIKGGEAIEAFASTTSKLATVTGMTVDSISSGMGRILTATGETQEGAKKFGDVFSALADKTRGGGEALVATAQQITMMTGGMKVSSENILSIASAVEGLGLRSRQAGMAVGQAFSRMSAIAEQGGVQLQTLALATGSTADEFKNLVKEDPSKAFTALLGAIQKVQATGAPVTEPQAERTWTKNGKSTWRP
jgi:TP901 family phage tail tape measure protein